MGREEEIELINYINIYLLIEGEQKKNMHNNFFFKKNINIFKKNQKKKKTCNLFLHRDLNQCRQSSLQSTIILEKQNKLSFPEKNKNTQTSSSERFQLNFEKKRRNSSTEIDPDPSTSKARKASKISSSVSSVPLQFLDIISQNSSTNIF